MTNGDSATEQTKATHRERCYGCYRPVAQCFCDIIPQIDSRTQILILQHARERFHAFNTARIVHRSLTNSRIEVGYTPDFVQPPPGLSARCGLLYPGPGARLIEDLPSAERPDQIVILDGTWHHARTMMRDVPWLRELPQYRIDPASPSQYRIRREPSIEALSTVEATVDVLRSLEPETVGLDALLNAFNVMIDRHVAIIGTADPRHRDRTGAGSRIATNVPRALLSEASEIVVAYGESVLSDPNRRGSNAPVYWVAQNLGTGERFQRAIPPPGGLSVKLLEHMELTQSDFNDGVSRPDFTVAWSGFIGDSTLVTYSRGTVRLLDSPSESSVLLKSIDFTNIDRNGTLADLLLALGLQSEPAVLPGRAGRRLANAMTLVKFLRESLA